MHIVASVKSVVYQNSSNGYTVVRLIAEGFRQPVTAVGNLPEITEGETLELEGEWIQHPKFGEQFQFNHFRISPPKSSEEIVRYLGSGLFKGIGPVSAQKIVDTFGKDTFEILDLHPERLTEVEGLSAKTRSNLQEGWFLQQRLREVIVYFQNFFISSSVAIKIYKQYGDQSIQKIRENPYRLVSDVWGIGFIKADEIALKLGMDHDSLERIVAGVKHVLQKSIEKGHIYLQQNELVEKSAELLKCTPDQIIYSLDYLIEQKDIVHEDRERYYLAWLFHCEGGIAQKIALLAQGGIPLHSLLGKDPAYIIEKTCEKFSLQYNQRQKQALELALHKNVLVITGGPGTGKTTTLMGILDLYTQAGLRVALCAPTGRAAKRMKEVTAASAETIHRMLRWDPAGHRFGFDAHKPLETDVVVVDEMSMVDTSLFYHLVMALPTACHLILVGDVDQLPAIGAGEVLAQLCQTPQIQHIHLEEITRQAEDSLIVLNAHQLNKGLPLILDKPAKDWDYQEIQSSEEMIHALGKLVNEVLLPQDDLRQWQIITPMNQGPLGIHELNKKVQGWLNPYGKSLKFSDQEWRVGDKVMQIKNNYEKGVYNGDVGILTHVGQESFTILFEEPVEYIKEETKEVQLAYVSTIHKSQGSEFEMVILLLHPIHHMLLQKRLLYTAMTRAKSKLYMITHPKALEKCRLNAQNTNRNTLLSKKIELAWESQELPF